jgi:hypothetical protein
MMRDLAVVTPRRVKISHELRGGMMSAPRKPAGPRTMGRKRKKK